MGEELKKQTIDTNNPVHMISWLNGQALESQRVVVSLEDVNDSEDDVPSIVDIQALTLRNQIAIMKTVEKMFEAMYQNHPAMRPNNRIITAR